MRAIRLHAFGPAENLRYEEVDDPEPGDGQVRIAVSASGVHLIDAAIREGVQGGPFPLPGLPMIPGREVAGVVTALERVADPNWLGQRVVAHLGQASGGCAEQTVANVESLHAIPDGLSDDAAVTMIGTGRTAMGILEVAQLRPDDVVLVTAAAGGLGNLLVQEARAVGATVVGVASGPAKVRLVRQTFPASHTSTGANFLPSKFSTSTATTSLGSINAEPVQRSIPGSRSPSGRPDDRTRAVPGVQYDEGVHDGLGVITLDRRAQPERDPRRAIGSAPRRPPAAERFDTRVSSWASRASTWPFP
jgi:threonine dehydrogenase-like Zn-dependent dehydrogenase